jgi:hypothetical protein
MSERQKFSKEFKSLSVNNIHLRRDTPEADDGCGEHVECDE